MTNFPYYDRFVAALAFRDALSGILFLLAAGLLLWGYQIGQLPVRWNLLLKIIGALALYMMLIAIALWLQ